MITEGEFCEGHIIPVQITGAMAYDLTGVAMDESADIQSTPRLVSVK